jgi:predicted nucleotidyltransferase
VQSRSDVIERTRAFFADAHRDVVAVYVFGSVARGTARPGSDVDVAVLFPTTPEPTLLGRPLTLADDLRGALGCPVDVVVLNDAPPDLVHRVLRDGVLVVERDRAARVRFEVRLRNEYFDLLPYLQAYRRAAVRTTTTSTTSTTSTDAPR